MTLPFSPPLALPAYVRQHCYEDAATASAALARRVALALDAALRARGTASLVVSGGRSPAAFLHTLSQQPLDWSHVIVSLADERCVPTTHADSNAGMLQRTLLQGEAAHARFIRLYDGEPTAEAAVAPCLQRLTALPQTLDVVVLGMGEDGHTASLFPGSAALPGLLDASAPRVGAVHPARAPHARISLSLPALLDSRLILLPIAGRNKRAVIEQACAEGDAMRMPVAGIALQRNTPVEVFHAARA